ncbi:DUF6776 family protein [Hydrocarboniclastica marina]|uniref:Uncharacterized protein n=1 Tax=Hydrocarboniclastica marina TaxID=2259620 RepID=A0A4P7XFN6_9ALTE|nr:DUF6776 family protein [Hydrocarboniclastica marina]MAL99981.1 hypothetical protein [Alteromonadaceae bacterium]QCF24932.1 hypothetical protein soil367_02640 [Hydrocarboniclastica marina]
MKRATSSDLRVVKHQPGLRLRQFLILLGFSICAGVIGFFIGTRHAEFQHKDFAKTRAVLAQQVGELQEENTRLRQIQINLERGNHIDQQAILEAQRTISQLEKTVAQLNSDLSFYKNIMAPGEVETNLQVQRLLLSPVGEGRRFRFRLSLTQVGDNRSYIAGQAAVSILGQRGGEKEVIPLRDVTESIDEVGVAFRFRYFQDVEGEMVLPEGFTPSAVQIVAQAEGNKSARVERRFEWDELIRE